MATVKTYDQDCYQLAADFLSDEPSINTEANRHALALEIQQTIEDEMFSMMNESVPTANDVRGILR